MDNIVNLWCLIFFEDKYNSIYERICCCIAKNKLLNLYYSKRRPNKTEVQLANCVNDANGVSVTSNMNDVNSNPTSDSNNNCV